jgi:dolichol-phosphate mannosyltransferase
LTTIPVAETAGPTLLVVIPAFKVADFVLEVVDRIGPEVSHILVVDDACPDGSGRKVENECHDSRVEVIFHPRNLGVGGAVVSGYRRAVELGADIVIKVDGDGQMAPELIPALIAPIVAREADYAKGNRFFNPEDLRTMPAVRLFGNAALSFLTKLSSGYWSIFDPTNGFTAIHASLIPILRTGRLAERYFFESDMLFRLNLIRGRVIDVPMTAVYGDEVSNLTVGRAAFGFFGANLQNFGKRLIYNYFLRNFSVASLYLVFGLLLTSFGLIFGSIAWFQSIETDVARATGTVMLSALTILVGLQFLIGFVGFDVSSEPTSPIHPRLLRLAGHVQRRIPGEGAERTR